jgi:hypothetical protein
MMDNALIKNIKVLSDTIEIHYECPNVKYAWLENSDKHFPDVVVLDVYPERNYICLDYATLNEIAKRGITVKLSISNESNRLKYNFANDFQFSNLVIEDLKFKLLINEKNEFLFVLAPQNKKEECFEYKIYDDLFTNFLSIRTSDSNFIKSDSDRIPLDIVVLGTCFSRSIFQSDPYFNPYYKKYFHVSHTFFHNSIISIMSNQIEDNDYLRIHDLNQKDVFKYIEIEFQKNFFDLIDKLKPEYIIMDNYIDANRPLIQISENQYLTYNTYFSKSIYKRKFVKCNIIYPNTKKHEELYRTYIKKFSIELKKRNLDRKYILLGCRLCEAKIDKKSGEITQWENLDYWIKPSNQNWDRMDQIFLEEVPNAAYIDMRKTQWLSDIDCPIKGGASPSHYQSGYYREILEKIKTIILN